MMKAKSMIPIVILMALLLLATGVSCAESTDAENQFVLSEDRVSTVETIQKLSDYEDLNLYSMEILYDYDLSHLTPVGVYDTQEFLNLVLEEAMPGLDIKFTAPNYGCSAFTLSGGNGNYYMGRNYDFKYDSSAMIVYCHPKNGYASVAHAALDNVQVNDPFASDTAKYACLVSPFICLDGMNEKGVGIAVLTLPSEPTVQNTGKPVLPTTILIRLVLDQAASTEEAIELISQYDIYATSGRDYHFYITDSTGDGRVVEFDCEDPERKMVVTSTRTVTNFYTLYQDKVVPNQKNDIYGAGKERYLAIEEVISQNGEKGDIPVAWKALQAAAQLPDPTDVTSNTQWSVVYNLTDLSYEFVLHRHWDDVYKLSLRLK